MSSSGHYVVLCNDPPIIHVPLNNIYLSYTRENPNKNINLGLPAFVNSVCHLPDRILDLLELAGFLFAADRLSYRGSKEAVEYHTWSRSFEFHMKVRDHGFWANPSTQSLLKKALEYLTGDKEYIFNFYPGHKTFPNNLFDYNEFSLESGDKETAILPFSGGLDSLAGTIDLLTNTDMNLCLVSHQTQSRMIRTQEKLYLYLKERFKGRLNHYKFICNLSKTPPIEESQRTRSFLYLSIAYAIAKVYSQKEIYVFENGITSLNFARREDLMNARASRTTHPQSIGRLQSFFKLVSESDIKIHLPFIWKTKADIIKIIKDGPDPALISSTVSCTKGGHQNLGAYTHCGQCFQCIDRRIASHAASVEEFDYTSLYALDCITKTFTNLEGQTSSIDYIRQAIKFSRSNTDSFYYEYLNELADLFEWIPDSKDEWELIEKVWHLYKKHGDEVQKGLLRMRALYDDPYEKLEPKCLLKLISDREYLKPEVIRLVDSISKIVKTAVPEMFRTNPPIDEPDLNEKIRALLSTHYSDLRSEHPTISFACAKVVPDHLLLNSDLFIESKYLRGGTSPAKASEGIASDLTKHPQNSHILFLVLDQGHTIQSDTVFVNDIESRGRCTVCILR